MSAPPMGNNRAAVDQPNPICRTGLIVPLPTALTNFATTDLWQLAKHHR